MLGFKHDLLDTPPNVKALYLLFPHGIVHGYCPILSLQNLEVTDDPFNCLDSMTLDLKCSHSLLGLSSLHATFAIADIFWLPSMLLAFGTCSTSIMVHTLCQSTTLLYSQVTPLLLHTLLLLV